MDSGFHSFNIVDMVWIFRNQEMSKRITKYSLRPNQALPEGIPLGQADQISRVQINIALRGFVFKENIRLKTQFVLYTLNIISAAA